MEQRPDFLRQVIDITPHFLFVKDREGRFTLVNQALADAYGTTVEGLIGKTAMAARLTRRSQVDVPELAFHALDG